MRKKHITAAIREKFIELSYRLEPENLTCDGEASGFEVAYKESAINAEWKALERGVGRKVGEFEVGEWILEQCRSAEKGK